MNIRLYNIWKGMKQRCYNPNCKSYRNYGGRGIVICSEWLLSYELFEEWALSNGYNKNLTIDRKDNNDGYTPNNCRWVDCKTQSNNTRTNHIITYKNKTQTLTQWCDELKLPYDTIKRRINSLHWDITKAFETPLNADYTMITYEGKTQSLADWSKELNLNYNSLKTRLNRGWPVKKAFTTKVREKAE